MSGQGRERKYLIEPIKLEYSDKEDKFRVLCSDKRGIRTLNLGRIIKCTETEEIFSEDTALEDRNKKILVFELTNEKRSLERAMLQFAHFKKEVERIGDKLYRVELEYDRDDETDVLIQIMSYGYHIKILAPDSIKKELASRLKHQMELWNW